MAACHFKDTIASVKDNTHDGADGVQAAVAAPLEIRVGTRGSRLARIQTAGVVARLEAAGHRVEVCVLKTAGDREQHLPFEAIGPPGVFVGEIELALATGKIDVAVHSYKDLPSASPEPLAVAAVPERLDPADVLLVRKKDRIARKLAGGETLPLGQGARVGTSSARRAALLRDLRPDLEARPIRGNLPTRIAKLKQGGAGDESYDAILLAAAGLERLDADASARDLTRGVARFRLDPDIFVPAPAQGALAVQVRRDDPVRAVVEVFDDPDRRREVEVERRLLARVEGGCRVAVGAWCRALPDGQLALTAVLEVDSHLRRATMRDGNGERLAETVARQLQGRRATERDQP